jgi:hypothetical protein
MLRTINPIYSPESISFQNDAFHKALTAIIDTYRDNADGDVRTEFEMALNKCIKDFTNINFDCNIGDYQMSTEAPSIDKNSPMIEGYGFREAYTLSKQSLADIRKSRTKQVTGLLDPNAAYVHGYFAELPPTRMFLNAWMIYGQGGGVLYDIFDGRKYTSREISAIMMHEIGHIWGYFDFLVRFRTTNQIMATALRTLDGTEDHGKRELIIKETSDMLELDSIDALELSRKSNMTVYTVIISNLARYNRTQSGNAGYDINSFEALADQFASRHGAGRDLVTGLDKLSKGTIHRRGQMAYFFMEFAKIALFLTGTWVFAVGSILTGWGVFSLVTSLLLADSHNDWYDKTGARFTRVRNDLINELKNPHLSKEDSARIREDIDVIDNVNKNYKDHTQFIGLVYDYLIPTGVMKRKDIEFQQALEGMASNKLYYYANKFKAI